jgi:hypothetical protein
MISPTILLFPLAIITTSTSAFHLIPSTIPAIHPSTALRNVWSNSQAVKDYEDFLDNKPSAVTITPDQPSLFLIPDPPHLPSAACPFAALLASLPASDDVVASPSSLSPDFLSSCALGPSFPIYVCVPPSALPTFLSSPGFLALRSCNSPQLEDLVFFSHSGLLTESALRSASVGSSTQTLVLLNAGVVLAPFTAKPVLRSNEVGIGRDTQGQAKTAGSSWASGKFAGSVSERVANKFPDAVDSACRVAFYRDVRRWLFEDAVLHAAVSLVGAVHRKSSARPAPFTFRETAEGYVRAQAGLQAAQTDHLRQKRVTGRKGCPGGDPPTPPRGRRGFIASLARSDSSLRSRARSNVDAPN